VSHDVTGKAAFPSPVRANRRARRSRRWVPSAVLAGTVGVMAPLAMMTSPATAGAATVPTVTGYTLINWAGGVFGFGGAPAIGGTIGESNAPVVGIAPDSTGKGYWVATANGGVYSIVPTLDGAGYYLVASDGGVFAFGDAKFYGSAGSLKLVSPIVGISLTSTGAGYYLVGADGGVFTFGDAAFAGTLSTTFDGPSPDGAAVGIAANPTGAGYLIATAQGAIVSYGGAPFFGSPALSGVTPAQPLVSVTYAPDGTGYWAVGADGGVFSFNSSVTSGTGSSSTLVTTGHAGFFGSVPGELGAAGIAIPDNIVGIAPTN
jgi:ribosomal protein L24E